MPSPVQRKSGPVIASGKGLKPSQQQIILQPYYDDGSGKEPRYYQRNAINAAIEAINHV
jgi:type I site-specific restriction endonuclease